jgi:hypothetical protein
VIYCSFFLPKKEPKRQGKICYPLSYLSNGLRITAATAWKRIHAYPRPHFAYPTHFKNTIHT